MFAVTFTEGQLEELLHIPEPWYIDWVSFSLELKQLDVYVKFRKKGSLYLLGLWSNPSAGERHSRS